MLRHGRAGYEAGKRSANLLKVKTFADAEFKVVDYKLGRGKLAGAAIFNCQTEAGHHFDVLAPGTVEKKKAYGEAGGKYVGRMLTVKYMDYTKTAEPVPFHPVAIRFREDL
jgi:ATP-dependent DNA ligase